MNTLLIDTNAYSHFRKGQQELFELFDAVPALAMNVIVLGELYAGFAMGTRNDFNRQELNEFLEESAVQIVPISETTATIYASTLAHLRRVGRAISTNDLWIAATAQEFQFDLCTLDADFQGIPGLRAGTKLADFS